MLTACAAPSPARRNASVASTAPSNSSSKMAGSAVPAIACAASGADWANCDVMSSATVAANNAVSYAVRGMASSDAVTGYTLRSAVAASESSAYSVRSAVSRDAVAGYEIAAAESSVYADSTVAYSVDGVAPSCPSAESIAAAVLAALQATTIPVNNTLINGAPVIGDGSEANPWRGVGVQP